MPTTFATRNKRRIVASCAERSITSERYHENSAMIAEISMQASAPDWPGSLGQMPAVDVIVALRRLA
jgi:hypothetical protein